MPALNPVLAMRLAHQGISRALTGDVAATVHHLLAVQAQDHYASLWALGLRTQATTREADVEQAVADRRVVRSWPMRGTLHLVAAEDLRWLLALLAARVVDLDRKRIERDYGLDARTLGRYTEVIQRLLEGGKAMSRPALYEALAGQGIATEGSRGLQILGHLSHVGVLCQGPRDGKQSTFVLLDDWLAPQPMRDRDEALGELALRYVRGHGPATSRDLAWWAGLTLRDAQRAWELARAEFSTFEHDGTTYSFVERDADLGKPAIFLLPSFDEYLVGFADREAMIAAADLRRVVGINGLFSPTVVIHGRVAATWKRELRKDGVAVTLTPLRALSATELKGAARAVARYGEFLGVPARLA